MVQTIKQKERDSLCSDKHLIVFLGIKANRNTHTSSKLLPFLVVFEVNEALEFYTAACS